jgi:EmrB/QacA subfamily drug resistance transporter
MSPESNPQAGASRVWMKQPCDEGVIRSGAPGSPCRGESAPWVLAATILGSSMAFIDGTVVNVALPALQTNLHATVVDVQWVVEAYSLLLSALILVGGALGDSLGRRLMFLVGVGGFGAASFGCGISSSIEQLILWRSVQGVGAAFLVPGSLAIISASFDEQSRGRAIGTWSGFTAMTTALGPVLGGWLIEHASWHWVFFINLPLAAVVSAISLLHVPESRRADAGDIDWRGALSATIALAGLVYGFIESETRAWENPMVFGSLIAGLAALLVFVFVEARTSAPLVPLWLFRSRSFAGANVSTLLLYAALGVLFFLLPMDLIQVQGYSATAAGAASLPMILLIFLLSRWSGGLTTRYGPRRPLVVGPLITALGFCLFAVPSVGGRYWTTFFPAYLVLGLGVAVSVAPLTTVVMSAVAQNRAGTASGINNAVARIAGVLAIAILGLVMIAAFRSSLEYRLIRLDLATAVVHQIESNAVQLAGLDTPANLGAESSALVRAAIGRSFVFGFRLIMFICAGLAVASASIASRMIPAGVRQEGVGDAGLASNSSSVHSRNREAWRNSGRPHSAGWQQSQFGQGFRPCSQWGRGIATGF